MDYRVIKEGGLFLLTDKNGDITGNNEIGHGLYMKDTRFFKPNGNFLSTGKSPSCFLPPPIKAIWLPSG